MKQRVHIDGAKLYRLALERMSLFNSRAAEELRRLCRSDENQTAGESR